MKILVALDGTDKDAASLTAVAALAREAKAELLLLNIVNPWVDPTADPAPTPHERLAHVTARRQAYLQECAQRLSGLPVAVRVERLGRPGGGRTEDIAEAITRVAKDAEADIVVVASKRPSGVMGILLGTAAQRLLRISPCPVLIVRPPEPS